MSRKETFLFPFWFFFYFTLKDIRRNPRLLADCDLTESHFANTHLADAHFSSIECSDI